MAVIALITERRCKLCSHESRDAIDALLEIRSNRGTDDAGVVVNLDYVLNQLRLWGVENPTRENISVHWRKHCQVVKGDVGEVIASAQGNAVADLLAILDSEEYSDNMDGQLERLWDLGFAEIRRRIASGQTSGITVDQLRWVAGERTRRAHNETQGDLLRWIGLGIADAVSRPSVVSARPVPELPQPEGVPGEVEAEDADWSVEDGGHS